ncbi:hypothetical protein D3C81_1698130 [compost metagenome]
MLVFGPVLILLIIFVPDGIVGSWLKQQARKAAAARRGKQAQPAAAGNIASVPTTRAGADHA